MQHKIKLWNSFPQDAANVQEFKSKIGNFMESRWDFLCLKKLSPDKDLK